MPKRNDVKQANTKDEVTVDCSAVGLTALNRKAASQKDAPQWCRKYKSALTSAVAGGQWTQTKKASVPKLQIKDLNC